MTYQHQLTKMMTLASIPGLVAAQWCSVLTAVTVSAFVLYALLVRAG